MGRVRTGLENASRMGRKLVEKLVTSKIDKRKQKEYARNRAKYEKEILDLLETVLIAWHNLKPFIDKITYNTDITNAFKKELEPFKGYLDKISKVLGFSRCLGFGDYEQTTMQKNIKKVTEAIDINSDETIALLAKSFRKYRISDFKRMIAEVVEMKEKVNEFINKTDIQKVKDESKKSKKFSEKIIFDRSALKKIITTEDQKLKAFIEDMKPGSRNIDIAKKEFINNHLKAIFGSHGIIDKAIAAEKSRFLGARSGIVNALNDMKIEYKKLKVSSITVKPLPGECKYDKDGKVVNIEKMAKEQNGWDEAISIVRQNLRFLDYSKVPMNKILTASDKLSHTEFTQVVEHTIICMKDELAKTKLPEDRYKLTKGITQLKLISEDIKKTYVKGGNYNRDIIKNKKSLEEFGKQVNMQWGLLGYRGAGKELIDFLGNVVKCINLASGVAPASA